MTQSRAARRRTPRNASIAAIVDDLSACSRRSAEYKLVQGKLFAELRARGHEDPVAIRRGFFAGAFVDEIFASIIVNESLELDVILLTVREALNSKDPSVRSRGAELGQWCQGHFPDDCQEFVRLLTERVRGEGVVEVRDKLVHAIRGGCDARFVRINWLANTACPSRSADAGMPMDPPRQVITSGPWSWHRRGRGKRRAKR